MEAGGKPRGTFLSAASGWFEKVRGKKVTPTTTAGAAGTVVIGGIVKSNEKNRKLVGLERFKTYQEFKRNCWIVGAGVRYFLDLISRPAWTVEPADDSAEAKEVAEFVEDVLKHLATPWSRIVRKAAMFRFYGFSVMEWTAVKRDDGKIGMLDIEARPQVTIEGWDVDRFGVVHGVAQRVQETGEVVYIPREKVLHFVDDSDTDSPEGEGLLRGVASDVFRYFLYERFEGRGYESDLGGVPVGKAPLADLQKRSQQGGDMSKEDVEALLAPMETFIKERIQSDEPIGVVLDSEPHRSQDAAASPSGVPRFAIDLLNGGQKSLGAMNTAIERKLRDIACVLGVEHMLIGGANRGSQALSRDKGTNFGLVGDSTLGEIATTATTDFVRPLLELNGIDKKLEPKLKPQKVAWRDIEQVTGALKDLEVAGLDPEDPAHGEVRDQLGLSRMPKEIAERRKLEASLLPGRMGGPRPPPRAPGAKPGAPQGEGPEDPEDPEAMPGRPEQGGEPVKKAFDPDQPRDDDGKWGDGGGASFASVKDAQREVKAIGARLTGGPRRAFNIDHLQRASEADLKRMAAAFRYIQHHGSQNERISAGASLSSIESAQAKPGR